MTTNVTKAPLEVKFFKVGAEDTIGFLEFDDYPEQIGLVSEKVEDGKRKRRAVFFPLNPQLAARMAGQLMEISGVQQISINENGKIHTIFHSTGEDSTKV